MYLLVVFYTRIYNTLDDGETLKHRLYNEFSYVIPYVFVDGTQIFIQCGEGLCPVRNQTVIQPTASSLCWLGCCDSCTLEYSFLMICMHAYTHKHIFTHTFIIIIILAHGPCNITEVSTKMIYCASNISISTFLMRKDTMQFTYNICISLHNSNTSLPNSLKRLVWFMQAFMILVYNGK